MQRVCTILILSLCLVTSPHAAELLPSYDDEVDAATVALVAAVAGEDSSRYYGALSLSDKANFLASFWTSRNPLVAKYFFGHHLGNRRYNVSDFYWERLPAVPELFKLHIDRPLPKNIHQAETLCRQLTEALPGDPIAMTALGYVMLEAGKYDEADQHFLVALKVDRKLVEARNGRGLSQLALGKRAVKALEEFRGASVIDRQYAAPQYNLGMGHLVIRSRDIGRWFEAFIEAFPRHLDAGFKLGAYHESGLLLEKDPNLEAAAAAYRGQVEVNPDHGKAWFQLGSVLR